MHYTRRAILAVLFGAAIGHLAGPPSAWTQEQAKPRPEARKVVRDRNEAPPVMRQEPRRQGTGRDGQGRAEPRRAEPQRGEPRRAEPQRGTAEPRRAEPQRGQTGRGSGGARQAPERKPENPGRSRPELRRRKP